MSDCSSLLKLLMERYEGETCNGQAHGEGAAYYEGGHTYKGRFSIGIMDGHGVFIQEGGVKYEGEFVNNMPMGWGTFTWQSGSTYEGEVYNGKRNGTGTYRCAKTGVLYTGQWELGKRHGKGEVYYNQDKSSWYKGDWVKNNREGWGVRCYSSGKLYSGEWRSNLRHGQGNMEWVNLGQEYDGMWQNGVQHGHGTHTWVLKSMDGSLYSPRNQYIGNFVEGRRHGQGTFHYSSGVIYEGEWRNDKRNVKGKFTLKNGRVFEGELTDEQMMICNQEGITPLIPTCGPFPLSGRDSCVSIIPDMALNYEYLQHKIRLGRGNKECKQVEGVVLMNAAQLRSIYRFYSQLGHAQSPQKTFQLTGMQFWRLLKDCNIHRHKISLNQIDILISGDVPPEEIHSPFTIIPLCRFLSCLVVVAYHIYHKDMVSQKNILATCFSKLMTDNILPHAKNVKGFLFGQPDCAVVAESYARRCWEIYKSHCKESTATSDDQTMTCRDLLYMFKDLSLLDENLTTTKLVEIITDESPDPGNLSPCLDDEITFLDFFEVLLASAEVKCLQDFEGLKEGQSSPSSETEARCDLPEVESQSSPCSDTEAMRDVTEVESQSSTRPDTEARCDVTEVEGQSSQSHDLPVVEASTSMKTLSPCQSTAESSIIVEEVTIEDVKTEVREDLRSPGQTEYQTRRKEHKGHDVELWMKISDQFFNQFFFPAFDESR